MIMKMKDSEICREKRRIYPGRLHRHSGKLEIWKLPKIGVKVKSISAVKKNGYMEYLVRAQTADKGMQWRFQVTE